MTSVNSVTSVTSETPLALMTLAQPMVVMIDGRSGAGKTALAERIATELGAQTLHLDELYPGWEGLAAGSRAVTPALRTGRYRRYDWARGAFTETVELDTQRPLVVEGCGAVTAGNLLAAAGYAAMLTTGGTPASDPHTSDPPAIALHHGRRVWSIWVACPDAVRRRRALGRDGKMFAPYWGVWARQEEVHRRTESPLALVDEVLHTG